MSTKVILLFCKADRFWINSHFIKKTLENIFVKLRRSDSLLIAVSEFLSPFTSLSLQQLMLSKQVEVDCHLYGHFDGTVMWRNLTNSSEKRLKSEAVSALRVIITMKKITHTTELFPQ